MKYPSVTLQFTILGERLKEPDKMIRSFTRVSRSSLRGHCHKQW